MVSLSIIVNLQYGRDARPKCLRFILDLFDLKTDIVDFAVGSAFDLDRRQKKSLGVREHAAIIST
ncbi:hypothetical protein FNYG_12306 [Fusarium nygamai]|uniref:Uncharacterized protein n=1 Tax=Gibberella nygamai TaxID=42673 RepID=A0A2K0VW45_GIBNY|nr:hypothetical protein FNYG_12306 [Fusarium nygamai]